VSGHADVSGVEGWAQTRRCLHGVAELVIAGPQYRAHGTIRLQSVPGGFGGAALGVQVIAGELRWDGGRSRLPIESRTCEELSSAAGLVVGRPEGLYTSGSGVAPDEPLAVDPEAATVLAGWFERGDTALRQFAPGSSPVLWPEHFDVAISLDEVNYGVSGGDAGAPAPYAYVGPWTPRMGPFWNAPFGALRAASALRDAAALLAFFTEGRQSL
jgi:hypothetical protein